KGLSNLVPSVVAVAPPRPSSKAPDPVVGPRETSSTVISVCHRQLVLVSAANTAWRMGWAALSNGDVTTCWVGEDCRWSTRGLTFTTPLIVVTLGGTIVTPTCDVTSLTASSRAEGSPVGRERPPSSAPPMLKVPAATASL